MRARLPILCCLVPALSLAMASCGRAATWYTLRHPIDSSQLTGVPWGFRSFWLQPWRSSLTTRPATALQDAIGIIWIIRSRRGRRLIWLGFCMTAGFVGLGWSFRGMG